MALAGRHDVLVTVVDELHRPAGGAGEQGGVDRDRAREVLLAAEAAAHGRSEHPYPVVRQPERVDQRLVHVVRALHRAEGGQRLVLERGDHPLALDVDVLLEPGPVLPLDDQIGGGERRLDVAARKGELGERRQRRGVLERQHRRQRLVLDGHGGERLPGLDPGGGRHQRHRLTHVPDDAVGQDRPGVVDELHAVRPRQVGGGDADRAFRGERRVEAQRADAGMRMRAAHRGAMPHAGQPHVVDVAAPPPTPWRSRRDGAGSLR